MTFTCFLPFVFLIIYPTVLFHVCGDNLNEYINYRTIKTFRIVGFDDLGGTDNFPTSLLEWRIAQHKVINYAGRLCSLIIVSKQLKEIYSHVFQISKENFFTATN